MNTLPPLWNHQVQAISKAETRNTFALFHEPGCGKTRTILEILRKLYNREKRVKRTLIISPVITLPNWEREIKLYTKIPHDKINILEGTISERGKQLQSLEGIAIVNYDAFVKSDFLNACIKWKPEILVADEAHRIKDFKSKRTKNLIKLSLSQKSEQNSFRFIMTGSPITNTQLDLWSQFYFLDHGKTFGESFFGFRNAFFINVNQSKIGSDRYFPLWVPKKGIDVELNHRLMPTSSIVKKEECLDLPPLIRKEIDVPMSKEQERRYKDMKEDFITYVKDKACVATIALTKLIRMQQILCGFLKLEDGSIVRIENPRAKVLAEVLEGLVLSSKVIVWAVQHEDYKSIAKVCEEEKIKYVEAHGLVSKEQKQENIEAFQKNPDIKVLIASPAAVGIGINLVEAKYSVWYSRNFSMEQDEQANARNYRGGSEIHSSVVRYDLITRKTIDEKIYTAIKEKKNIAENILSLDLNNI